MTKSEPLSVRDSAREVVDDYHANWKNEWVRDGEYIRCYRRIAGGRKRGKERYFFQVATFRKLTDLDKWIWDLQEKTWVEKRDLAKLVSLFTETNS